jgi:predicted glycoside hydrolase/deacetylase ChbG (UPF0249 family)
MPRLIVHADDLGLSSAVNRATFAALACGGATSASLMVPCAAFAEAAAFARAHPALDVGLHLTLTSETCTRRWGPVAPRARVPSLVAPDGCFWAAAEDVFRQARVEEVEIELRAQIETALAAGLAPSHLDSHMFVLFRTPAFRRLLDALAREYRVPAFNPFRPPADAPDAFTPRAALVTLLDHDNDDTGLVDGFAARLRSGVNVCLVHCGVDDEDLRALYDEGPYDARWRQRDTDIVCRPAFRAAITGAGIALESWRA